VVHGHNRRPTSLVLLLTPRESPPPRAKGSGASLADSAGSAEDLPEGTVELPKEVPPAARCSSPRGV